MMRQFFIDQFNHLYLTELCQSADDRLKAIAAKAIKETAYHLRRSKDWVVRLGDGTEESHERAQKAADDLWGYLPEIFEQDELEKELIALGIAPDTSSFKAPWDEAIAAVFEEATLTVPNSTWAIRGGREGYHTENLGHILTELQYVHRAYPGCEW